MSAALRLVERDTLERLETSAIRHKENALREWQLFLKDAEEILKRKLYLEKYPTWNEYCKAIFGFGESRVRQYRAAMPYAELIQETLDCTPSEKQIRDMRQIVPKEDSLLFVPVFQAAQALAPDFAPQKRHFQAAYETLKDASKGAVSVGGLSIPSSPETVTSAMKEAMIEADERFAAHRKPKDAKRWIGTWQELVKAVTAGNGILPLEHGETLVTVIWSEKE